MKIGFFGTPELAARCLAELHAKHEISFVVTAEDKESGRNLKLRFPPAKEEALRLRIPVLQPRSLKDPQFSEAIRKFNADIFVIVAYGKLIPRAVFDLPPLKTVNLHPSLLPKYRGAAPVPWALINGERETGITVQLINEKLDSGDIIEQEVISLDINQTAADLWEIVYSRGPDLLNRAVTSLASGNPRPIRQDESQATYCRKIDRNVAMIDWGKTSLEIHNLVRGLNPKPVAFSFFRGENIRIWRAALAAGDLPDRVEPGAIIRYHRKRLLAGTGKGFLEIISIQPANRKIMDCLSFINGYRLSPADHFG
ncbi:MAG: methionyl-tRNA formyltransferase [Spirochaetes bacterium RBG_16_49_21]|nr:MAG: methionyl-tRNA formyltransferase [Spirochaetes bacterium RBG_16_49_21]